MRKLILAAVAVAALVATSIAVANGGFGGGQTAEAVAGTFSATSSNVSSRTCTTSDNKTIVVTSGKYTGTATGDADLTGAITIQARSVVNTTDKIGTVDGVMKIDVSGNGETTAAFSSVYDGGSLAGLAVGRARGPHARLLGNISATFDPSTGFSGGKIGGATSGGSAVELAGASCSGSSTSNERASARGTISALSAQSITVAGLTCAIPSDQSSDVNSKYKQGDTVAISCSYENGQSTLTRIQGKQGGQGSQNSQSGQNGSQGQQNGRDKHGKKKHD
jgi:hypothetical protein